MNLDSRDNAMSNKLSSFNSSMIDILRILATYSVLVGHGLSQYGFTIFGERSDLIQNSGVIILLLLSGFLTAYSLEQRTHNENFCYKLYVKNRINRIYREYIPALLFIVLLDGLGMHIFTKEYPYCGNYNFATFICNLFMIHYTPFTLYKYEMFGTGRPLWTLPVQWWLYLCFGKIFFIAKREKEINFSNLLFLGLCTIVPVWYAIDKRRLTTIFLCGVLAYYFYSYIKIKYALVLALLVFCVGTALSANMCEAYNLGTYVLYMVSFMLALAGGKKREVKLNKILKAVANITFIVYLIHYSIMIFISYFNLSKLIMLCVLIVASSLMAYCLYKLVQKII